MAPVRRTAKPQPLSKDETTLFLAAVRFDAAFRYLEQNGLVENDQVNFISCLEQELVRPSIFSKTLEFNAFNTGGTRCNIEKISIWVQSKAASYY